MSINVIKIGQLLKEIINEVGDLTNIQPVPYDVSKGTFTVDYLEKQYRGKVQFTRLDKKGLSLIKLPPIVDQTKIQVGYSIGYSIEGISSQAIKGDVKLLLSILKAVSEIVADHITKQPDAIYFIFAESKVEAGFNDPQKLKLYQHILGHNLPKGFRMGKAEIEGISEGIFIVKNS